jgi:prepilin-type N-terminal cleavage/methylation domain-containing protein
MLNRVRKSRNEGFTIIEVMIVLAIAGLIILVVLLAVPALQRNGRNTAIKNDAAAIAGGVSEFASNNDGGLPTKNGSSQAGSAVTLKDANGTAATAKVQASTTVNFGADKTATSVTPNAGELTVTFGTKCGAPANNGTQYTIVVSGRATSVVYAIETAGASQAKCLDT